MRRQKPDPQMMLFLSCLDGLLKEYPNPSQLGSAKPAFSMTIVFHLWSLDRSCLPATSNKRQT